MNGILKDILVVFLTVLISGGGTYFVMLQRVAVLETRVNYGEQRNQEKDKTIKENQKKINDNEKQISIITINYRNEKDKRKELEDALKQINNILPDNERKKLKKLLPLLSVDYDNNLCIGNCG